MIKKYSLYALVALLGAVSINTHAVEIAALQEDAINFVTDRMKELYTPIQRVFTAGYVVARVRNNVFVKRISSSMSANPTQAGMFFDGAIIAIAQHILNIYGERGTPESIDVFPTDYPNTFRFTPIFSNESIEVENNVDESDSSAGSSQEDEEVENSVDENDESDVEDNNNNPATQLSLSSSSNSGSSNNGNSSGSNNPPELWR